MPMIHIGQLAPEDLDDVIDVLDPQGKLRSRPGISQLLARAKARLVGSQDAPAELPPEASAGFYSVGTVALENGPEGAKRAVLTATSPHVLAIFLRRWVQSEVTAYNAKMAPEDEVRFEPTKADDQSVGILYLPQRRKPLLWGVEMTREYADLLHGYSRRNRQMPLFPNFDTNTPWNASAQPSELWLGIVPL